MFIRAVPAPAQSPMPSNAMPCPFLVDRILHSNHLPIYLVFSRFQRYFPMITAQANAQAHRDIPPYSIANAITLALMILLLVIIIVILCPN